MVVSDPPLAEFAEDGRVERLERDLDPQLLAEHLRPARADRQMDVPARPAEGLEQGHGIGRAAGAGHGQDEVGGHRGASRGGFTPTYSVAIPKVNGYCFVWISPRDSSRSSIS